MRQGKQKIIILSNIEQMQPGADGEELGESSCSLGKYHFLHRHSLLLAHALWPLWCFGDSGMGLWVPGVKQTGEPGDGLGSRVRRP